MFRHPQFLGRCTLQQQHALDLFYSLHELLRDPHPPLSGGYEKRSTLSCPPQSQGVVAAASKARARLAHL
jgi:hypothetical protein